MNSLLLRGVDGQVWVKWIGGVERVYGMQGFGMSLTYIKKFPQTGDTDSLDAEFLKAGK